MASRKAEDSHVKQLDKLLKDSGLVCIKSPPKSPISSEISEESELLGTPIEVGTTPETVIIEETEPPSTEVTEEEHSLIFPTPSLRLILPDKVREIQKHNRIHVLPERFKTDIDPAAIPKIARTAEQAYIDILAELVGCVNYKNSLPEYWFLDTLANLLRRAQEDLMDRPTQAVLILWFCEWMKEMQHFDAADRQRMIRRFQDNMLSAAKFIAEETRIPKPKDVGVYYEKREASPSSHQCLKADSKQITKESKMMVSFENKYQCSLRDLTHIIHYIFDLFSTDYQYNLIRSVFTFSPDYILIDARHQIQRPRRLYAPLKPPKSGKDKSPKKDAKAKGKKSKEVETEEFLALMELKAREQQELNETELREKEEWNRMTSILPLKYAATDEFFDKYWPPPPPEPEPEVVHDEMRDKRGKEKKKKK